jgi:hypothetical protein
MPVTAKFKVSRLTPMSYEGETTVSPEGVLQGKVSTVEVELTPDYAQGRNAAWSAATPSGVIRMTITKPEAFSQFVVGRAYTITFERED